MVDITPELAKQAPDRVFNQVWNKIDRSGVCSDLSLRVRQEKKVENVFHDENTQSVISEFANDINSLQEPLGTVLKNPDFLHTIADYLDGKEISRELIMETGVVDPQLVDRVWCVLNLGFDPNLLALGLQYQNGYSPFSLSEYTTDNMARKHLFEALKNNQGLRQDVVELAEYWDSKVNTWEYESNEYPEERHKRLMASLNDDDDLLSYRRTGKSTLREQEDPNTLTYLARIHNHFLEQELDEGFAARAIAQYQEWGFKDIRSTADLIDQRIYSDYNIKRIRTNKSEMEDLMRSARQVTEYAYFQEEQITFDLSDIQWVRPHFTPEPRSLYNRVQKYARAFETGRYLIGLSDRAIDLIRTYLTPLYVHHSVNRLSMVTPFSRPSNQNGEPNGWYRFMENEIGIDAGKLVNKWGDSLADESVGAFVGHVLTTRKVEDFQTMVHEHGHSNFWHLFPREREQLIAMMQNDGVSDPLVYYNSALYAIDEGFATFTERMSAGIIKENSEQLGFNSQDIKDVFKILNARITSLRNNPDSAYTQGLYSVFLKIYGDIYAKTKDHNLGLVKIREFIDSVDPIKAYQLKRNTAEFEQLVISKNPEMWLKVVGRSPTEEGEN
jgi:hypothetical protein